MTKLTTKVFFAKVEVLDKKFEIPSAVSTLIEFRKPVMLSVLGYDDDVPCDKVNVSTSIWWDKARREGKAIGETMVFSKGYQVMDAPYNQYKDPMDAFKGHEAIVREILSKFGRNQ